MNNFMNLIINNSLYIDKEIYMTIIIGQITIYGIMLTFYQFVASFQASNKIKRYLGVNLSEYYINTKMKIYNNIISKWYFMFLFILEILYKPIIYVVGSQIPSMIIKIMNLIWYLFVVFYFLVFIVLFYECAKCIFVLRKLTDGKKDNWLVYSVKTDYFKKPGILTKLRKKRVDLLQEKLMELKWRINSDYEYGLQNNYDDVIEQLFRSYIDAKGREINVLRKERKVLKNQVAWVYNNDIECDIVKDIIEEKYFLLNEGLIEFLSKVTLQLAKMYFIRAEYEGYEEITDINAIYDITQAKKVECGNLKENIVDIFNKASMFSKKTIVKYMYREYIYNEGLYQQYVFDCIIRLMKLTLLDIICNKKEQESFSTIFESVLYNRRFNDYLAFLLCDNLESHQGKNIEKIIVNLHKENSLFVFMYIVGYYSLYKFRFDWKYIDVESLRLLWEKSDNMQKCRKSIIDKIKKTRISHRFDEYIYDTFMESFGNQVTTETYEKIYNEDLIDTFYIIVINVCVLNRKHKSVFDDLDIKMKIHFLNEVSKHKELMRRVEIMEIVLFFQLHEFVNMDYLPSQLEITLRTLLLSNINLNVLEKDKTVKYLKREVLGQYALIKLNEYTALEDIKENISRAYILSNKSVDEYVEFLSDESYLCGFDLSYVQKEKMKKYLLNNI